MNGQVLKKLKKISLKKKIFGVLWNCVAEPEPRLQLLQKYYTAFSSTVQYVNMRRCSSSLRRKLTAELILTWSWHWLSPSPVQQLRQLTRPSWSSCLQWQLQQQPTRAAAVSCCHPQPGRPCGCHSHPPPSSLSSKRRTTGTYLHNKNPV